MYLPWGRGGEGVIRGKRLFGEGLWGPTLPCCAPPSSSGPLPSVSVGICLGACARSSPVPSPNPPSHPPPPLIAAIPVAAGCHSAVTPLPIIFRGKKGGAQEKPPASLAPHPPLLPLPEVPAVVRVGVTVFCDDHSVGELAACQALHGFLAVKHRGELHKDLREQETGCEGQVTSWPPRMSWFSHSNQPA